MQVQLLLYVFLALLGKMDADKFEGSDGRFIGFLLSFLTLFLTISAFILVNIIIYYDQHGNQVVLAQLNRTAAKKSKQEQATDRLKSCCVFNDPVGATTLLGGEKMLRPRLIKVWSYGC